MALDPILQRALDDARAGKLDLAIANVRRIVQRQPSNIEAMQVIALLLMQSGRADQAVHHLARAVQLRPGSAPLRNNYAGALMNDGKAPQAVEQSRKAVEIDPGYAEGWLGLCNMLMRTSDSRGAIEAAERGLRVRPESEELKLNLALSLGAAGRFEELARVAEEAHRAHPRHAKLHSLHLMSLNYSGRAAGEVAEAHREFGCLHQPEAESAATGPEQERALRVGWLSGDLRGHSVAYFVEALFQHTPALFEGHVFSLNSGPLDAIAARLKSLARSWHDVSRLDDASLDRRIREEKVDILIDLHGHTPGNRLTALTNKPAPIMVTAIGYPNTTGVGAVDYRLVDSRTDPAGSDSLATESLLRLDPCFLCYRPPDDAPEPVMPGEGPITFGSFNALAKFGTDSIELWRRVLAAVPRSRLLLKGPDLASEDVRGGLNERIGRAGIDVARVELLPGTSTVREHLATYGRVHIALDTAVYNGTTTTCEALWMGVPVVTLRGDRHSARVGASLLSAVGHGEWVAASPDEYAAIAAGLAADFARLGALRASLREQVRGSVLCDGPAYAARFYGALRECWRRWCASQRS